MRGRMCAGTTTPSPHLRNSKYPNVPVSLLLDFLVSSGFRSIHPCPGEPPPPVHEILELVTSQLSTLDAEHERDSIHKIGFSGTSRADDRGEVFEWSNELVAATFTPRPEPLEV